MRPVFAGGSGILLDVLVFPTYPKNNHIFSFFLWVSDLNNLERGVDGVLGVVATGAHGVEYYPSERRCLANLVCSAARQDLTIPQEGAGEEREQQGTQGGR